MTSTPLTLADTTAVLFDLDGVITPTAELHMRAWRDTFAPIFEQAAVRPYEDADYFLHLDGKPRYDGVAALLASRAIVLPWGEPTDAPGTRSICAIGNMKNELFAQHLADEGVAPYPGSVALIDALRDRQVPLAVVSSSKNAPDVLRGAGLFDRFVTIVDGNVAVAEGLPGKPAPDTFLRAAALLSSPAATTAVIEDAIGGVAAGVAGAFGLVVGVDRGAGAELLSAAGAHLVVSDLAELLPDVSTRV